VIHDREAGFTLVEALVAFAILSIAVIMSFQIHGDGLRRMAAAERERAEVIKARELMTRLSLTSSLQPGERTETQDGSSWRVSVREVSRFMGLPAVGRMVQVQLFPITPEGAFAEEPALEQLMTLKPPP
jgi:Tfp pilus assembly protein PilV